MRTAVALIAALLLARPSARMEVRPPLVDYLISSWADSDGAPIGTVYAIQQDRNGYLWLGADGGLLRFDGFRFRSAHTILRGVLPQATAVTLCLTVDGSLWVGFANGEISRISNDRVQPVGTRGLTRGSVDVLVQDSAGTMLAVAQGRIHRFRSNQWEALSISQPEDLVLNAYVGSDAALYVGTNRGLYRRTTDRVFTQLAKDAVWAITQSPKGDLWITHPTFGFGRPNDDFHDARRLGNGYRMIRDRRGQLWVATIGGGLWLVHMGNGGSPEAAGVTPVPAVPGDSAQALFEDRDGNIWIGTPSGLHRLTRKILAPVASAGPVLSIEAASKGSDIWAGTRYGLVRFSHQGREWRRTVHSSPDIQVNALHHDRQGVLWVGTNKGLARLEGDRAVVLPRTAISPAVYWLTSDSKNTLWLGNRQHLFRLASGVPVEVPLGPDTPALSFATADDQGRLWLAFENGGIGLVDAEGRFVQWQNPDGLARVERWIYAIVQDSRGIVWIGASDGLHRYDDNGRFSTARFASPRPGNGVWAIVEDEEGYLWLNADIGLLRIHPDEVVTAAANTSHPMRYRLFDGSDGLAGASVRFLRAARAGDSTLWFARGGALTVVNPRALVPGSGQSGAAVRIESASTEQGAFDVATGRSLAAGTRRLDLAFSVLQLSPSPRLRFRHRLVGFEDEWRDAGTRGTASYTNLSPGTYNFEVEAYSTEGVFARAAAWEFRVPPTVYQTRAFQLVLGFGVAAIISGAWWLRTGIVRRQFSAVLAERARVSREIHDTLLQGVVGIALQLDHLQHSQEDDPADNARRYERLKLHLEAYIKDARHSIRDLRSPVLERHTFEQALNEMGSRLRSGTSIDLSVRVQGKPRDLPARMENELLRIGHEAIVNAVRHANPSRIDVELRFDDASVALRIRDDGCGFELPHLSRESSRQFGLVSMHERARAMGGVLRVETSVHNGTDVEAVLPVHATA